MATIKFFLRKSSRSGSYPGKLSIRLIHARRVRVLTLAHTLFPGEWDAFNQQVIFREESGSRYSYLSAVSESLEAHLEQFTEETARLEKQGRYSVEDISLACHSRRGLSGLQGFTAYLSRKLEKQGQERTARAYRTACRALSSFNRGKDIPLKHINHCMIKEFETALKEGGKAMNTISYYMRMLRAIYHKAIKEKLIEGKKENPFGGIFTGFQSTRKRALNLEQLRQLNKLDFSDLLEGKSPCGEKEPVDKGLYDSWRYFFFCFHARGMSFVDMAYLRKDNLRRGVISYYRKKTGQKIDITVSPILEGIIDSFRDEVRNTAFLFPVIKSPGKPSRLQYESGLNIQNKRLKRLARLAAIDLDWGLSTHVSRHSWATAGKNQHLPLSVISEGLGHSSEKMTYTYLASFDHSVLDKASERIDRAVICSSGSSGFICAGL